MSDDAHDWWKGQITLSLVLQVVIMLGGWLVLMGTIKATISDHERRINIVEAEIVPRKEHESNWKIEEQKERLLDERLANIERAVTQVQQMMVQSK